MDDERGQQARARRGFGKERASTHATAEATHRLPVVGKTTLVESLPVDSAPVQRRAEPDAPPVAQVIAPPPADRIQRLFGGHENRTGMPVQLKRGIESLSGMSMDHVRVHRDSGQPAAMNALAYAQDSDIHLGPGQEHHLPHEAWHVVQQAQGRVQATRQMKRNVPLNEDPALEQEADVMGAKAMSQGLTSETSDSPAAAAATDRRGVVQRVKGAKGTQQAGQILGCTINAEFTDKHVANDLIEAKSVTERRVATGKPLAMVNGTLANHMAPLATWIAAISVAPDVVPPEDKWNSAQGDDGPQFVDKLAKVAVVGFEARVTGGVGGNVVASAASYTGYVGGHWEVAGCEDDDDGGFEDGTGTVTMDISHMTS